MLETIKSFFKEKNKPTFVSKGWKQGMWVVDSVSRKVGILAKLDSSCEIHRVDNITGETREIYQVPLTQLRQARWSEIPECRRKITKQQGEVLGYGS